MGASPEEASGPRGSAVLLGVEGSPLEHTGRARKEIDFCRAGPGA